MSDHSINNPGSKDNFMISSYTRAAAIEDDLLIDVSALAKEAGLKLPVAVTASVWQQYIVWSEQDTKLQTHQDTNGRLWDVLMMLQFACRFGKKRLSSFCYPLSVIPRNGKTTRPRPIRLKAVFSGGDHHEPVLTIMLPEED